MNIADLMGWFNPTRWLILLGLGLALVLGYFAWADHIGNVREAKVRAEYQAQATKIDAKREAVAEPIVKRQIVVQERIRTVTEVITREVPTYVKATDCAMPGGFRLLHDAAANGEVPNPAGIPDAAPVPAQDVASAVASNYGTCHETAERLRGLQEWVRAQEELK